ncbi:MAG: MFS transporter [Candidatus Levybacteria bacterium]|nr:MFS transporter [Candidatus Levybacteria bacterium]
MGKLKKILLISDAFYILSGALMGPIYALYVEKIGGDLLDASTTFALFMLTAGIVVFALGLWEDKSKHKRKFVVIGYGLAVLGTLGYLFVNSVHSLFLVQIILGLSAALKDPAYDELLSKASGRHLAFSWGEWEALDYFALGTGALIGGIIVSNFGFQPLLFAMFLMAVFSFLVSMFLLRAKINDERL